MDPLTYLATKEPIDRNSQGLTEDIPARLFDSADCAHADHAHAEKRMAIELLINVLDVARILAKQHGREVFDGSRDRPRLPLERCLSPSEKTRLVGKDFNKYPIPHLCVHNDRLDTGNLHRRS
jgi:hypothetical protein